MNNETRNLLVRIKGDTSDLKKALGGVTHQTNGFSGAMQKAKRAAIVAGTALVAAGTAAVAFGVSSVKSYQESEEALTQLNAVLKSTKGAAGVTAKAATDLADSLQKVTRFSDEEVMSAQNLLLTFTKISKDIFPDATKTVLDMSTALGQDLKSSSVQLGKALNNPIKGITALQRVGVAFTDEQKKTIETLVKSGKTMEAQKIILAELKTEFGGSAEAAGTTFAGKLDILRNQFDEVKESIGKTIVTALIPLGERLSAFVASDQFKKWAEEVNKWIAENLPKAINWLSNEGLPFLKTVFDAVWPVIKVMWEWMKRLVEFMNDHKGVIYALAGAFVALKVAMFIKDVVKAFQAGMATVRAAAVLTNAVISTPMVMPAIVVAAALASLYQVWRAIQSIREAIKAVNEQKEAQTGAVRKSEEDAIRGMQQLLRTGTPEQKRRAKNFFAKKAQGFATGVENFEGGLAYVHKGEVLTNLPKGTDVIPKNKVDNMMGAPASNVELHVHVGMYAGMQTEKREIAAEIWRELWRIAKSNGIQLPSIGVPVQ